MKTGKVHNATLIIGANDIWPNLDAIFANNPKPFVSTLLSNVATTLRTVAAAGPVRLMVSNVPDIGVTPYFRSQVTSDPTKLQSLTNAVKLANEGIQSMAAKLHIPMMNLFGLANVSLHPITVGGVQITNLYGPDGFHPNTVGQGIIADTILSAFSLGYHLNLNALRLSDQQILTEAGIAHAAGTTYFNVAPYVIVPPHGSVVGVVGEAGQSGAAIHTNAWGPAEAGNSATNTTAFLALSAGTPSNQTTTHVVYSASLASRWYVYHFHALAVFADGDLLDLA